MEWISWPRRRWRALRPQVPECKVSSLVLSTALSNCEPAASAAMTAAKEASFNAAAAMKRSVFGLSSWVQKRSAASGGASGV